MVLDVGDGKRISRVPRYHEFVKQYRKILEERAEAFHALTELRIAKDSPRILYIFQREFAVLNLEDESVPTLVGSDEATTCHLTVMMSRRKRILSIGHVDGVSGISGFVSSSLRSMRDLGDDLSEGVDVAIVGGFVDDRGDSEMLSSRLLDVLARSKVLFFLRTTAISEFNSHIRPELNLHFPRCYGLAVNTETNRGSADLLVVPAVFEELGPCPELRSTRFCSRKEDMVNVYNAKRNEIELAPIDYQRLGNLELLVNAPDAVLRRYSTSPVQEKTGYEQRMRNTLRFMLDHPKPCQDVFNGAALRFRLQPDSGRWEAVK